MRVEVGDLDSFREAARVLLVRGVAPEQILFSEEWQRQSSLLQAEAPPRNAPVAKVTVPPAFLELSGQVGGCRTSRPAPQARAHFEEDLRKAAELLRAAISPAGSG